jgi:L-alanine-DL-glutamate epimerase-like enolase superfamily enzyme
MMKSTDVRVSAVKLFFLEAPMRVPLKFGGETISSCSVARVHMEVTGKDGRTAWGWGESVLSPGWAWPAPCTFAERDGFMKEFSTGLAADWSRFDFYGHPMEVGHEFLHTRLDTLLEQANAGREFPMPHLAALNCTAAFDLGLHDAYGVLHQVPVYDTYNGDWMNHDLSHYLEPAAPGVDFKGRYPADYMAADVPVKLPVWHLVGGKDLIAESERTGQEPGDGYPVVLDEWISADGLKCLKVKLRGNDSAWDYRRMVDVGRIALEREVHWLSPDFNCLVTDPAYVNNILDKLVSEHPAIYGKILYVEQPFPYDLENNRIDVHSVSARKPLFMDESCHDWSFVRMGRNLGWTGVALKTCKTQTGALLSMCWAKAHGMTLMVQDLTNPMLSIIPHILLAAHAGTIMGVECNAAQFYPAASAAESVIHPGIYKRNGGVVDFSTLRGPGFGYRADEIDRQLPPATFDSTK